MSQKSFLVDIDLNKNQLLNIKLQNLATAPTLSVNDKGYTYYDTTDNLVKTWTGSSWVSGGGTTEVNLGYSVDADSLVITSSTGTGIDIPSASGTLAGILTAAMFTKLSDAVTKSDFDAYTILAANSDNTPITVALSVNTLLGRINGNIQAVSIDSDLSTVSASDDTIPSAKAAKAYVDSQISAHKHYQLYKPDGSAVVLYTDSAGKLHIDGDIIQSGTTFITHAENLNTSKDIITLRDGAIAGLGAGEFTGLIAKLYDGVNDGRLIFDNTGTAKVGDVGSEQALATRVDSPTSGYIAYWEGANTRLNFKQLTTADITDISTFNAASASKLYTARTIAISGDISGSVAFDGSANVTISSTLPTVATAGTYKSVTVNAKGLVTAGTNPTTLAGFGITDGARKYAADITGTGSQTSFAITHNLGTTDIATFIKDATTLAKVETEEIVTNTNVLTVNFNTAPANGKVYRVTIIG